MKELRRLLAKQPELGLGLAVFAGLALGAGWIPLPSLSLPSLSPQPAQVPTGTAAGTRQAVSQVPSTATATPAPAAGDMWD